MTLDSLTPDQNSSSLKESFSLVLYVSFAVSSLSCHRFPKVAMQSIKCHLILYFEVNIGETAMY